jgi:hypothetical protein
MQDGTPVGSRPVIDRIVLVFVVVCLGIAVVRLASVAVAVPYTMYLNHREGVITKVGDHAATAPLLDRLRSNRLAVAWWGLRPVPYPGGGNYLQVVSHHSVARTLGSVIGVLARKGLKQGIAFDHIIVPTDRTALDGQPPGLLVQTADGDLDRTTWRSLSADIGEFASVPVAKKKYDPVLTASQFTAVAAKTNLVKRANMIYLGAEAPGDSGTWVLFAHVTAAGRQYLLIPLEASPLGGVL